MPDNKWRVRLEGTMGGHRVVIGAGFLVDSCRVLTCAHVVRNVPDIRATFAQAGRRDLENIKATAVFETAWSGVDDPADVAVLELEDPVDIAPARLEVLPPEQVAFLDYQADDLKAHGYPATSGLTGAILRTRITSWSYVGEWIPIEAAAGHAEFPRMGFSGAAVFDEHTGHVLGMITTGNTNSDIRIGRMLPCEIIRKYWEDLDDLLDLRWLPPAEARALHAIVRGADVTGSYTDLVVAAFPGPSRPSDLRSVWDAIRYSCEEINDDGRGDRLARVLVKIEERLTDQVVIGNLRAWREQTLPKPAEETEQSASIFVRVDPLREDKAYQVTLSAYIDGIAERAAGTVKATGNTLRAQVQHEMPAMLERMGDRDPIIEFALPRDFLLKKRVGEWHTGTFGIPINSYQVIVRDVARLNPAYGDLRSQWRLRSKKLRTPPWPSPDVIECKSKPAGISKMLLDPKIFSVVLVSVPTLAQLNAILNAGIPVVFWPSEQSCNGGDHSHCQPRELAEGLREKVGTADFDKLPVLVKDLRHGRGTDHSMELTLLWDDPGRIPPDPPMFTDGDHV